VIRRLDRENAMTATPISSKAPSETWLELNGHPIQGADALDSHALAELLTAPADAVADRARKALLPVLPHTALVLVSSGSPTSPVQIAGPHAVCQRLATVPWLQLVGDPPPHEGVERLELPGVAGGLRLAGWIAKSSGPTVALILGHRTRLTISPEQERVAIHLVERAATRFRAISSDPPPRTLALSHAMSQERERIRLELRSRHAATLSSLLHTLRAAASAGGSQTLPPSLAKAIDMASRGLLDLQADAEERDAYGSVPVDIAFSEIETEVRETMSSARIRLVEDLEAPASARLPYAVAHAARLITRLVALGATQRTGVDKVRLLWRLADDALTITVADNGAGCEDTSAHLDREEASIRRLAGELRGRVTLDSNPQWGTTFTCWLPLHDRAPTSPETPMARGLAELRDREREVLELLMEGLRNRDIASRLFISERTVKFHVSNILAKLQVRSRTEAIALAHRAGSFLADLGGEGR
jgi:DNA-binding CsgD family transcriptional regulator